MDLENPKTLSLFKILLSSLLMVVQSSSVNMERSKDGNVELSRWFVVMTFIASVKTN